MKSIRALNGLGRAHATVLPEEKKKKEKKQWDIAQDRRHEKTEARKAGTYLASWFLRRTSRIVYTRDLSSAPSDIKVIPIGVKRKSISRLQHRLEVLEARGVHKSSRRFKRAKQQLELRIAIEQNRKEPNFNEFPESNTSSLNLPAQSESKTNP